MHNHRSTQADAGDRLDLNVAWSFSEIKHAAEALLRALDKPTTRLSEAGLRMAVALWLAIAPNSFTRLAHWLVARQARLHAWRVSAAHAGAKMALRFVMPWYPDLALDRLMGQ